MKSNPHPNVENNFDLIRLFAAAQVAITHSSEHLQYRPDWIRVLEYFPGVPIFFFISGFLIYQSYSNIGASRWAVFFSNRALRLYPALMVCFCATVLMLYVVGHFSRVSPTLAELGVWLLAMLSVFQFYNPPYVRDFATGAINGSLWTITVELQFYLLTPLLYSFFKRCRTFVAPTILLFMAMNLVNTFWNPKDAMWLKLINLSFIPWLYMFATGACVCANESIQRAILRVPAWVYLLLYALVYHLSMVWGWGVGNAIHPVAFLLVACLVFKLAHTLPQCSERILHGNDISYGIYIYHMPIVNLLVFLHLDKESQSLAWALVCTALFSVLSWFAVEKPLLRLKKRSLRQF